MSSRNTKPCYASDDACMVDPKLLEKSHKVIEDLVKQLEINEGVTANLVALLQQMQRTRVGLKDKIKELEHRVDNYEAKWTKELDDEHKKWTAQYNLLLKREEYKNALNTEMQKVPTTTASKGTTQLTKKQLEQYDRRLNKINEGLRELVEVADSTEQLHEIARVDHLQCRKYNAQFKELEKKKESLYGRLSKQLNIRSCKPLLQMMRKEENAKGRIPNKISKLIDGFQKISENLDEGLKLLEKIKRRTTIHDIDKLLEAMRGFKMKIQAQSASLAKTNKIELKKLAIAASKAEASNSKAKRTLDKSSSSTTLSSLTESSASEYSDVMELKSEYLKSEIQNPTFR